MQLQQPKLEVWLLKRTYQANRNLDKGFYLVRDSIFCNYNYSGFLFGPLVALKLGVPFVPIRKKGRLPGQVLVAKCKKEHGEVNNFELKKSREKVLKIRKQ